MSFFVIHILVSITVCTSRFEHAIVDYRYVRIHALQKISIHV